MQPLESRGEFKLELSESIVVVIRVVRTHPCGSYYSGYYGTLGGSIK
jgi:hypothetical protein